MKLFSFSLALLQFIFVETAAASAIGMVPPQPDDPSWIGYAFGGSHLSVQDPDGTAPSALVVQPLTLILTAPLGRFRYWSEVYYEQADLSPSVNEIGQNLQRFGARVSLARQAGITAAWAPWFGVGLDVARDSFTLRHTVDEDNYLLTTLPDRTETNLGMVFNIVSEWSLGRQWQTGAKLEKLFPFGNGVESLSLSAVVLYAY